VAKYEFKKFSDAREWARKRSFSSSRNYRSKFDTLPSDMPKHPNAAYKNQGWKDWYDFLGLKKPKRANVANRVPFLSFEDARNWARSSPINSETEWRVYRKKDDFPLDVPTNPSREYAAQGWKNWADFLNTKNIKYSEVEWKTFEEAKLWAKKEGIKDSTEWRNRVQEDDFPDDIYKSPHTQYTEFTTYPDFLGSTERRNTSRHIENVSYEKAKEWARNFPVLSSPHWEYLSRKDIIPRNIPINLRTSYKEFKGWRDFLGFKVKSRSSIKESVLALELSWFFDLETQALLEFDNFKKYCDIVCLNKNFIIEYDGSYWHSRNKSTNKTDADENDIFTKNGWDIIRIRETPLKKVSERDLIVNKGCAEIELCVLVVEHLLKIGILVGAKIQKRAKSYIQEEKFQMLKGDITTLTWLNFEEAHKFVLGQKIKSETQWRVYRKQSSFPKNIPKNPQDVYFYSWKGWAHWLRNE
jgi:hypothetical protein